VCVDAGLRGHSALMKRPLVLSGTSSPWVLEEWWLIFVSLPQAVGLGCSCLSELFDGGADLGFDLLFDFEVLLKLSMVLILVGIIMANRTRIVGSDTQTKPAANSS
jgi:hypothetical protein